MGPPNPGAQVPPTAQREHGSTPLWTAPVPRAVPSHCSNLRGPLRLGGDAADLGASQNHVLLDFYKAFLSSP